MRSFLTVRFFRTLRYLLVLTWFLDQSNIFRDLRKLRSFMAKVQDLCGLSRNCKGMSRKITHKTCSIIIGLKTGSRRAVGLYSSQYFRYSCPTSFGQVQFLEEFADPAISVRREMKAPDCKSESFIDRSGPG